MKHKEEIKICRGSANGLNVNNLISQNIFEDEETGEVIINDKGEAEVVSL